MRHQTGTFEQEYYNELYAVRNEKYIGVIHYTDEEIANKEIAKLEREMKNSLRLIDEYKEYIEGHEKKKVEAIIEYNISRNEWKEREHMMKHALKDNEQYDICVDWYGKNSKGAYKIQGRNEWGHNKLSGAVNSINSYTSRIETEMEKVENIIDRLHEFNVLKEVA